MNVDLRPLGWARAAIGALILLRTTPLLAPLDIWFLRDAHPLLGWPTTAWSFAWLPAPAIQTLCVARTLAALLFALGFWTRAAGVGCATAGYLVAAQQPLAFHFTIHLLYQSALLLGFVDSGCAFAVRPAPPRSPQSSYGLLRLFIVSIYAWAGLFKLRPDWLDGRTLALYQRAGGLEGSLTATLLTTDGARAAAATCVAAFELIIGPLLLWRRTRGLALPMAFLFHLTLEVTAHPDLLGWGMMALLLCFLPERDVRTA